MSIIPWEDEFPISRYLSHKAVKLGVPLNGTFELTSRCNFNCKMCYVHEQKDQYSLKQKELSVEQWMKIAREAKEKGLLFLLLTGGEAMVREDFLELYEKLSVMGFRISINTNGSLLNEKILESFQKFPPRRINVSLYGASEETYEELCEIRAAKKVKESIHKLRSIGISVRTTMMLTSYNCQDMESVYKFAKSEDTMVALSAYLFPPSRLDHKSCGYNSGRLSAREAGKYMVKREQLLLNEKQFKERAMKALHMGRNIELSNKKEGEPLGCMAGRGSFWITWDGKMRPCGLMVSPEADVLESGFEKAWEQIHMQTEKIRLPKECACCENKELCRACAAMCQSETGSFDEKPEYVCKMTEAMKEEYKKELEQCEESWES